MMIEPKLRFKADDGSDFPDWEEKTLGDEGKFYGGLSGKTKEDFETGDAHFVTYMNVYKNAFASQDMMGCVNVGANERQNRVLYGDLLFTQSSETVEEVGLSSVYLHDDEPYLNSFCMGYRFNSLEDVSPEFIGYCMRSGGVRKSIMLMGQGISRINLGAKRLETVSYRLPSLPEQRKIADLLSAVDDVIAAQEAEVATWEKRKKGVMQKLFSQEVRFKADDGSDFPDWESTTVGELFTFVTEKNESGRISDVITNSAEHGLIPQREYFDKDIAVEGNTEGYTVIHKGDFVYNPRKSTIAPFGPFNIYERDEVGIVSPLYTCLTPRDGETAPYLSWYFKTSRWHRYIVTHGAQGGARHDRVGMTNALMKGIPVMLPSLPEQRKIADCLTSLDDVIAKAKDELDAWRELKKGLLQQMFV